MGKPEEGKCSIACVITLSIGCITLALILFLSYLASNTEHFQTLETYVDSLFDGTSTYENTEKETVIVTVTVPEPVRICLDVENIMQKPALPNGCEIVSLAIALRYAGYSVDPVYLYENFMPRSPFKNGDPWTTYVGDAKDRGYGCYAPCVVTTANNYLNFVGSELTLCDVSGKELSYYERLINVGTPVIMWTLLDMNADPKICWEANINGKDVVWHEYSHCMVLIGYTDDTYIFCDPLKGVSEYSKSDTEKSFKVMFRQACILK